MTIPTFSRNEQSILELKGVRAVSLGCSTRCIQSYSFRCLHPFASMNIATFRVRDGPWLSTSSCFLFAQDVGEDLLETRSVQSAGECTKLCQNTRRTALEPGGSVQISACGSPFGGQATARVGSLGCALQHSMFHCGAEHQRGLQLSPGVC